MSEQTFVAFYAGTCVDCGEKFPEGTSIRKEPAGYVHASCGSSKLSQLDLDALKPVCIECFMIAPCGCPDGV